MMLCTAQDFDLRSFPLDCQSLVIRVEMGNMKQMKCEWQSIITS